MTTTVAQPPPLRKQHPRSACGQEEDSFWTRAVPDGIIGTNSRVRRKAAALRARSEAARPRRRLASCGHGGQAQNSGQTRLGTGLHQPDSQRNRQPGGCRRWQREQVRKRSANPSAL